MFAERNDGGFDRPSAPSSNGNLNLVMIAAAARRRKVGQNENACAGNSGASVLDKGAFSGMRQQ
jgi:hypothetical protein